MGPDDVTGLDAYLERPYRDAWDDQDEDPDTEPDDWGTGPEAEAEDFD